MTPYLTCCLTWPKLKLVAWPRTVALKVVDATLASIRATYAGKNYHRKSVCRTPSPEIQIMCASSDKFALEVARNAIRYTTTAISKAALAL